MFFPRSIRFLLAFVVVVVVTLATAGVPRPARAATPGADMDYGPFLTTSLDRDRAVSE